MRMPLGADGGALGVHTTDPLDAFTECPSVVLVFFGCGVFDDGEDDGVLGLVEVAEELLDC